MSLNSKSRREKGVVIKRHERCYWCRKKVVRRHRTVEHLLPKKYGGTDAWGNLVMACIKCNNTRGMVHEILDGADVKSKAALERVRWWLESNVSDDPHISRVARVYLLCWLMERTQEP